MMTNLTTLQIVEGIKSKKFKCKELVGFYLNNIEKYKDKNAVLADAGVLKIKEEVEKCINKKGRVLLRQSGTESVIRVMVESETHEKCVEYVNMIVKAMSEGGHCVE